MIVLRIFPLTADSELHYWHSALQTYFLTADFEQYDLMTALQIYPSSAVPGSQSSHLFSGSVLPY